MQIGILQLLQGYPTLGYPRITDPDKDSKIMDPPDTLKLPGYPIFPRPTTDHVYCRQLSFTKEKP